MASDQEGGPPKYSGLEFGVVCDNKDPLGLGRIRVTVPGILDEPSGWAPMLGTGSGGAPQRGRFEVPPVGADVGILFHRGDPQRPYYIGGHYGKPTAGEEVPTDVKAADIADRPKIASEETEQWIITRDDRPDQPKLQIKHKTLQLMIDIDAKKGIIEITAEAALSFKSNGFLKIQAPHIQIGNRVFLQNGKPVS